MFDGVVGPPNEEASADLLPEPEVPRVMSITEEEEQFLQQVRAMRSAGQLPPAGAPAPAPEAIPEPEPVPEVVKLPKTHPIRDKIGGGIKSVGKQAGGALWDTLKAGGRGAYNAGGSLREAIFEEKEVQGLPPIRPIQDPVNIPAPIGAPVGAPTGLPPTVYHIPPAPSSEDSSPADPPTTIYRNILSPPDPAPTAEDDLIPIEDPVLDDTSVLESDDELVPLEDTVRRGRAERIDADTGQVYTVSKRTGNRHYLSKWREREVGIDVDNMPTAVLSEKVPDPVTGQMYRLDQATGKKQYLQEYVSMRGQAPAPADAPTTPSDAPSQEGTQQEGFYRSRDGHVLHVDDPAFRQQIVRTPDGKLQIYEMQRTQTIDPVQQPQQPQDNIYQGRRMTRRTTPQAPATDSDIYNREIRIIRGQETDSTRLDDILNDADPAPRRRIKRAKRPDSIRRDLMDPGSVYDGTAKTGKPAQFVDPETGDYIHRDVDGNVHMIDGTDGSIIDKDTRGNIHIRDGTSGDYIRTIGKKA